MGELYKDTKSYFKDGCFSIDIHNIDTSIGLGFYISNHTQYQDFKARLLKAMKNDKDFLIGFEEETPNLDFDDNEIQEVGDFDDSFEII